MLSLLLLQIDPSAASLDMSGDTMAHVTGAALLCYLLDWLKRQQWFPWLHFDSGKLNRWVSVIGAFFLAVGIEWTGDAGAGWTIHIPPLTVVLSACLEWGKQFATQQVLFDVVPRFQKRPEPMLALPPTV